MRSWKTTVSGIVSAAGSLVLFLSSNGVYFPRYAVLTAGWVMAGGLAALGIAGKDSNVTGETKASLHGDQAQK